MKNIHIIPTDKPSRLRIGDNINFVFGLVQSAIVSKNDSFTNQNIYITSDEEIKEGDWFLDISFNNYGLVYKSAGLSKSVGYENWVKTTTNIIKEPKTQCKKIILTTDQSLDSVQLIDDEFLEWFVKNPSCEEVEVIYDKDVFPYGVETAKGYGWYKIIMPKEEPKTNLEKLPFPELVKEFAEYYKNIPLVEEPKQETLEEAAEKYFDYNIFCDGITDFEKEISIRSYIAGAKLQAERMYSEEDMREAFKQSRQAKIFEKDMPPVYENFEEWFEQFKKK